MPAFSVEATQVGRVAILETPLGDDKLLLTRCEVSEGLSELFEIRIDAISEDGDVDFSDALGANCAIKFSIEYGEPRSFSGVLAEAQHTGQVGDEEYYAYRLVLRPWFWLLTRCSDCRIFHDMTSIDIINKVFQKHGMQDFRVATTHSVPSREYTVQYRETDFNFVSRLMEQDGIYFYFEHGRPMLPDGKRETVFKHVMVLCDSLSSHKAVEGMGSLKFNPLGSQIRGDQTVFTWTAERRFTAGKQALNDYNYRQTSANLDGTSIQAPKNAKPDLEFYDYPGRYKESGEGGQYARILIEAERAHDNRRHATGDALMLAVGGLVEVTGHQSKKGASYPNKENREYLVVRSSHVYVGQDYRSGGNDAGGYFGNYEFLPSDIQYRAPVATRLPRIHGVHSAIVTGKGEIDVDEMGRILVTFFWDRDHGASCRVRVAQTWADNRFGAQVIPRVTQEVLVSFEEGDPDRPLVTGCVYNDSNVVPYELPGKKTYTGIKSNTSTGGGGYNEFYFDDATSQERIRMHASKDHSVEILHAEKWDIGEKFEIPKGSPSRETTLLKGDDKLTIATGDQNVDIAMEQNLTIGLNRTTKVAVQCDTTVGASHSLTVGATKSEMVGASRSATVGAADSLTVGAALSVTVGGVITLMGGGSTIILSPAGIQLVGPTITCVGQTLIPQLKAMGIVLPPLAG